MLFLVVTNLTVKPKFYLVIKKVDSLGEDVVLQNVILAFTNGKYIHLNYCFYISNDIPSLYTLFLTFLSNMYNLQISALTINSVFKYIYCKVVIKMPKYFNSGQLHCL